MIEAWLLKIKSIDGGASPAQAAASSRICRMTWWCVYGFARNRLFSGSLDWCGRDVPS
jgi:hypothetical protein